MISFFALVVGTEVNAPKNGEPTEGSPSQHCSSTPVDFGQEFLSTMTTLEHPRFPPDLAQNGFYPFRQLKSVMKERHFCDVTIIIKNATEGLKRLS
jgi:hypothetical protein